MRDNVIYISGPMSGIPELNYPAFFEMESLLKNMGYVVENPATIPEPKDRFPLWRSYMNHALNQLVKCDSIIMLEGWEKSKGACCEFEVARRLNMNILFEACIRGDHVQVQGKER